MADEYYGKSNNEYYGNSNNEYYQRGVGGEEDERGFLATVGGAAAGGYAGAKLGGKHNIIGGITGAVVGSIAANKLEDEVEEHRKNKKEKEKEKQRRQEMEQEIRRRVEEELRRREQQQVKRPEDEFLPDFSAIGGFGSGLGSEFDSMGPSFRFSKTDFICCPQCNYVGLGRPVPVDRFGNPDISFGRYDKDIDF
ncbi:uncharacterized protein ASCRUDRAFT_77166 [Ascoidea rubescens DSM 1968]|uniref:Glycine zipper 2TM domain-containing protein n=1 Tax=Ascoidea rubescens DSM 1968 TaxID=1344418 RepID=A0A1D2VD84_9ASCO|nr:hypothetical protein ASCRUDRAFT_77166 [Ascoidea rubescens DSM 1968]ODV59427.1 hypothetical protein ASCRUDRAFT_77166 [Ascoidea rubescens DSM 1968]